MYVTDLHQLIRDLMKQKFYGSLEVRFDSGKISVIKKTESLKLVGNETGREVRDEQRTR